MHLGHARVRENASLRGGQDNLEDSDITVAEVLKREHVQNRITALALAKGTRRNVSKDVFMDMVMQNYTAAHENGDYSAANKALELLGKSMGYVVDQRQTLQVTASMNKPLNTEDQTDRIRQLAEIAGIKIALPAPKTKDSFVDADFEESNDKP